MLLGMGWTLLLWHNHSMRCPPGGLMGGGSLVIYSYSHHDFAVPEMVFAPEWSISPLLRASDGFGPGWWDPAGLALE